MKFKGPLLLLILPVFGLQAQDHKFQPKFVYTLPDIDQPLIKPQRNFEIDVVWDTVVVSGEALLFETKNKCGKDGGYNHKVAKMAK